MRVRTIKWKHGGDEINKRSVVSHYLRHVLGCFIVGEFGGSVWKIKWPTQEKDDGA
jgi:hypothetical protein